MNAQRVSVDEFSLLKRRRIVTVAVSDVEA